VLLASCREFIAYIDILAFTATSAKVHYSPLDVSNGHQSKYHTISPSKKFTEKYFLALRRLTLGII
jgi:hypothetical protein